MFQGHSIAYSTPLIDGVFTWLTSNKTSTLEYTQVFVSLILLAVAFILCLGFRKNRIHLVALPLAVCFGLIISFLINPVFIIESDYQGSVALIDSSHIERFNLDTYTDDSLSGLMVNLMRNNYIPIMLRDFSKEKIKKSEMIVFNAPTLEFSGDEVEFLKQYMEDGGLVVLATGFEDKAASMPLLREFSLDVYDIPLGPVPYVEEDPEAYQTQPKFVSSWPIEVGDVEGTQIFYSTEIFDEEYILMTFSKHGDGGLLFIADSEFLLDKNIETLDLIWPGNLQFIKNIIDELVDQGVL
jgi:hypothetical protein